MRLQTWGALVLTPAFFGACVVNTENAPCKTDENCPNGQICVVDRCKRGGDGGSTGGGGTDAGACQSDPACTAAGPVCDPGKASPTAVTCVEVSKGCFKAQQVVQCPSPAQTCDAGACVCPATACAPGKPTCGGPDGGFVVSCAVDVNGGCGVPGAQGQECDGGEVCVPGAGGASCVCPPATNPPVVGSGCNPQTESKQCGSGGVMACLQVDKCPTWWMIDNCAAAGLDCGPGPDAGTGKPPPPICLCPPNPSRTFYADPIRGTPKGSPNRPTGLLDPPECRFWSLSDALATAGALGADAGTVVAVGLPYPEWTPDTQYGPNSLVVPPVNSATGSYYRAVLSSRDGGVAPWKSGSGPLDWTADSVEDQGLWWSNEGFANTLPFATEPGFPLAIAPNTRLTTEDCADPASPCDGGNHYAIVFFAKGSTPANTAVFLDGGASRLEGFDVVNYNGPRTAALVSCSGGKPSIRHLALVGGPDTADPNRTTVLHGLRVTDGCDLAATGVWAWNFATSAIEVESSLIGNPGKLTLTNAELFGDTQLSAAAPTGIRVSGGTLDGGDVRVQASNPGLGVSGGSANLSGSTFSNNVGSGIQVSGGQVYLGGDVSVAGNGMQGGGTTRVSGIEVQSSGSLNVKASQGNPVLVYGNSGNGITLGGLQGGSVRLEWVDLGSNGGAGLFVGDLQVNLSLLDLQVHDNGEGGIVFSPTTPSSSSTVQIQRAFVTGNKPAPYGGMNDTGSTGGILFGRTLDLTVFDQNRIFANIGHQVGIFQRPLQPPWKLGGAGFGSNQVYSYCPTSGGVGIYAENPGPPSYAVSADGISWQSALPSPGFDYQSFPAPPLLSFGPTFNVANPSQHNDPNFICN